MLVPTNCHLRYVVAIKGFEIPFDAGQLGITSLADWLRPGFVARVTVALTRHNEMRLPEILGVCR